MAKQVQKSKSLRMVVASGYLSAKSNVLLLLLLASCATSSMAAPIAGPFFGDGTFYGESQGGHCSLWAVGWKDLPWARGIDVTVAMNKKQYDGSKACGSCIRFRTLNPDCKTCGRKSEWVSADWKFGLVADECPECAWGALDIAKSADGRWKFEWELLQCNVGNSPFRYTLVGSNPFYIKLMISNARYSVQAVSVETSKGWISLARQPDNAFVGQPSGTTFPMPLKMKIMSRFNDVVQDELRLPNFSGSVTGKAQFADKGYTTVGQRSEPESVASE